MEIYCTVCKQRRKIYEKNYLLLIILTLFLLAGCSSYIDMDVDDFHAYNPDGSVYHKRGQRSVKITETNNKLKTKRGIGIDSTLNDVIKAYDVSKFTYEVLSPVDNDELSSYESTKKLLENIARLTDSNYKLELNALFYLTIDGELINELSKGSIFDVFTEHKSPAYQIKFCIVSDKVKDIHLSFTGYTELVTGE